MVIVPSLITSWIVFHLGPANDTALEEKLAAMFDLMRQKQRDDMELFVQSIRTCWRLECADLKNEMMKLRTEVVDLQLQYQRMQNLH